MSRGLDVALKIDLQTRGARASGGFTVRAGGAGPADGVTVFSGGVVASVPTEGLYVADSPYRVEVGAGGRVLLFSNGRHLCDLEMAGEPRFCGSRTPGGVEYRKIAVRHGRDGVGSTVVQSCSHGARSCTFCAIAASRKRGATTSRKSPGELALAAAAAEAEGYSHMVLTTGTSDVLDAGIPHLERCAEAVKSATGMEVHVQFEPPADLGLIDGIAKASDSVAINIESFDEGVRARATPGKAATSTDRYIEAWRRAVSAYGAGQVASFIMVGLGETERSVLEGARLLASLGVYPLIVPLRPLRGTPAEGLRPPDAAHISRIYERAADAVRSAGITAASSRAGCVRCGACSAFTDITG